MTGETFEFVTEQGFWCPNLNALIAKECSGGNLFIVAFTYLTVFQKSFLVSKNFLLSLVRSLFQAYLFTCITNSLRIYGSISLYESEFSIYAMDLKQIHLIFGMMMNYVALSGLALLNRKISNFTFLSRFRHLSLLGIYWGLMLIVPLIRNPQIIFEKSFQVFLILMILVPGALSVAQKLLSFFSISFSRWYPNLSLKQLFKKYLAILEDYEISNITR